MGQEQQQLPQEINPSSGGSESLRDGEEQPQDLTGYGALLNQYGQAMVRIGQLEAQVDQLTGQLSVSSGQIGLQGTATPGQEPQGLQLLADRIEALQQLVTELPARTAQSTANTGSSSGSPAEDELQHQRDDELRQIRLQLNSVANQLANTEDELRRFQEPGQRRRLHRQTHRPWWKKLAGNLGLR